MTVLLNTLLPILLVVYCLLAGFQTGIWLRWFIRPWRQKSDAALPSRALPLTVLICARNEAENIRRHLPQVLQQQYPAPWELLLVNDASTDETAAILTQLEGQYAHLRVLHIAQKTRAGKKTALLEGLKAARYPFVALSDADCRPASLYWLQHLSAPFLSPDIELVLGYGPFFPAKNAVNAWSRFELAVTALQYVAFTRMGKPYMGVGRNMAWKKSLFERSQGFQKHIALASGDDDLFVNDAARAGNTALCLHPDSFMYSEAPQNLRDWLRQKQRHLSAGLWYKPAHIGMLALVSFSHTVFYFLWLVLLLSGFQAALVWGVYSLRLAVVWYGYRIVFKQLQEKGLLWAVPLLDGLLAVYYGAVYPWAFLTRKSVRWKP